MAAALSRTDMSSTINFAVRHPVVADGHSRVRKACEQAIRSRVRARYAARHARAGFFERVRLRRIMRKLVRRHLRRTIPRDALYATHGRSIREADQHG